MLLNDETGNRVINLLKIGKHYNKVTYVGCWSVDTVDFLLSKEVNGINVAGIVVTINDEFKLLKVTRVKTCIDWNRREYGNLPIV
jgi:hypothetical protein